MQQKKNSGKKIYMKNFKNLKKKFTLEKKKKKFKCKIKVEKICQKKQN